MDLTRRTAFGPLTDDNLPEVHDRLSLGVVILTPRQLVMDPHERHCMLARLNQRPLLRNFLLSLLAIVIFPLGWQFFPPLVLVGIMPLLALIELELRTKGRRRWLRVLAWSSLIGTAWVYIGGYGLVFTISTYGDFPSWQTHLLFPLITFVFSIKLPLAMTAAYFLRRRFNFSPFFIYPVMYMLFDIVTPELFPWYVGSVFADWPLFIQIADLIGKIGIGGLIVIINVAMLYLLWTLIGRRADLWRPGLLGVLIPIALVAAYGGLRLGPLDNLFGEEPETPAALDVAMIQADADMATKKNDRRVSPMEKLATAVRLSHEAMTSEGRDYLPDLLIWPESTIWHSFDNPEIDDDPVYSIQEPVENAVTALQNQYNKPMMYGGVLFDNFRDTDEQVVYNVVTLKDPMKPASTFYRKRQLVPFGEGVPFKLTWPWLHIKLRDIYKGLMEEASHPTSTFTSGEEVTLYPLTTEDGDKWLVMPQICYETLFARITRENVTLANEKFPEEDRYRVIVEQTNNAWFGKSLVTYLHHASAVMRTVEFRVPMVRATNTGISEIIDAYGRPLVRSTYEELETEQVYRAAVPGVGTRWTVYQVLGDWLVYGWLGIMVAIMIRRRKRENVPGFTGKHVARKSKSKASKG